MQIVGGQQAVVNGVKAGAPLTPPASWTPRPLREVWARQNLSIIIYGNPGIGKTRLAATAPGPRIWLNLEEGGLITVDPNTGEDYVLSDDPSGVIRSWEEAERYLRLLESQGEGLRGKVRTVIVDSLSMLARLLDRQILAEPGKHAGTDRLAIDDYQTHSFRMLQFVERLTRLPVHTVMTAHIRRLNWTNDLGMPMSEAFPELGGQQAPKSVAGVVSIVGYLGLFADGQQVQSVPGMPIKGERRFYLQSNVSDPRQAKVRSPYGTDLPDYLSGDKLSLTWLIDRMLAAMKSEQA